MTKQEFKEFCHEEFSSRGFAKRRGMYYRKGEKLLCGLKLQKSMAEVFYVNYGFFIGEFEGEYPSYDKCDIKSRICVLSKDTIAGRHFMDIRIEYELYNREEIKQYFDEVFEKYIIPPLEIGKDYILKHQEHYFESIFPENLPKILEKLNG